MSGRRTSELNDCYIIRDLDDEERSFAAAHVIGTNGNGRATHLRILTGEHAFETRTLGHFEIFELVKHSEANAILGTIWARD